MESFHLIIFSLCLMEVSVMEYPATIPDYLHLPDLRQIPPQITEILNRMTERPDVMEICNGQGLACKEFVCKMRKHEVFDPCMGNCEKSCLTRYRLKCSPECVPKCICEVGYVREGDECVPVFQCVTRIFEYKMLKGNIQITPPVNHRQYPYFPKMRFSENAEAGHSNDNYEEQKHQIKGSTLETLVATELKKRQEKDKSYFN